VKIEIKETEVQQLSKTFNSFCCHIAATAIVLGLGGIVFVGDAISQRVSSNSFETWRELPPNFKEKLECFLRKTIVLLYLCLSALITTSEDFLSRNKHIS